MGQKWVGGRQDYQDRDGRMSLVGAQTLGPIWIIWNKKHGKDEVKDGWQSGREEERRGSREGNGAEAPAGPPHVSGTVLDKAPGPRTRGNTGVRLCSWWEIRKTRRSWLAPNPPFFPTGEVEATLCRRADSQRWTTPAANRHYFMERVAILCPPLSVSSKGPAVFPQHRSHCGCAGKTCRILWNKSALIF